MRLQQLDTELKKRGLNMTFREKQSLLSQSGPISEVLERHLNPPQAPQLPALQMGGQYNSAPASSTRVAMPFVPDRMLQPLSQNEIQARIQNEQQTAYQNSLKQARQDRAKEWVQGSMKEIQTHPLWQAPASISPLGVETVVGKAVGAGISKGVKILKNAYKLNPWAFKAIPGSGNVVSSVDDVGGGLTQVPQSPNTSEQLFGSGNVVKLGFPNPLAIADRIIPRPPLPTQFLGIEDSWNYYSPLNLIPGYGKKLVDKTSSYPNFVGFRKFGNSINDVIESQSLRPKGGKRMGAKQIAKEGNWAEPGKVNENYPGVFEATMNPQIPGSNIKLKKWSKRSGIVGTTKEGDVAIPLTDPGLSFNRRLPFSNKYVPIDKQKLIEKKFQLATQLPHVQSLIEKYGLWAGAALTSGYIVGGKEQALENLKTINKYSVDPIINWSKEQWADFEKTINGSPAAIGTGATLQSQAQEIPNYQTGGQYDPTPASSTRVAMPPMLPLGQMLQNDERVRRIEENQRLASQLPNELKYQGPVPAQGKIDYPSTDRRSSNFSGTPNMQFAAPNMQGQMRANTEEFYAGLLDPGIPGMGMGNRIASSVAKMRRPLNRYLPTRYGVQRADDMRSMRNAPDIDPDKKREMLMRDMEESLMNDREEALQQMSYADEFDYDEMIMAENIEASINRSNPELDRLNEIIRNQLRNQIPAIQYPTFGKPVIRNKSGYTKDELLQIAKNKDVLQSMDDNAIRNTVLKPNGEVVPYNTESLEPYFSGKNNVNMIPVEEYTSRINDNIQRLNTIIANKNTSGVDYRAVRLDPRGVLEFEVPSMPGKTTWSVGINPGEWRGEVEDVVDAMYLKSVPGLQMKSTAGSVFPDGVPRKGTRAYESLNEYLKELGLGRVSSGFNSQTRSSEGVWDNLINSDRAVGYKANKGLTYGTMKTGLGAAAGLETYRRAQNQE